MKKTNIALLTICALALVGWGTSKKTTSTPDLVNGDRFMEHVRYLASDELAGRGNGSDGLEEAAQYIEKQFREIGLTPAGENGTYFQKFTVSLGGTVGPDTSLGLEGVGLERSPKIHSDFEPMTFTGSGQVDAPIVFVGYSITAPEHQYDDYGNIDVEGKVVLMLRRVPREGRHDGPFDADRGHATFVTKVVNAKSHKAAAVLLLNTGEPDQLVKFGDDLGAEDLDIPAFQIKRELAEKILESFDKNLAEVQKNIDEDLVPSSFELSGVRARLDVNVTRARAEVQNVLGYLAPAGSSGEEELLVIGGHYDHVGRGHRHSRSSKENRGKIHNGADDNASGTAGVIEVARAFSNRSDLERGILFAAFAGEELGLLGSSYYTRNPTLPLDKTVTMINLDMVGRLRKDKLYIGGVGTSETFKPELEEIAKTENLEMSYSFSGYGSSDHTSFTIKEIPSLFFFTGLHEDYHLPTDDWDEINADGAERVLETVYRIADYVQGLEERPTFNKAAQQERRPSGGAGRGYGAWFGSVPDFAHEGKGVGFSGVRDGSPAAEAGLQAGDVLIEFGGTAIDNLYDFTDALRRHKPGDEVIVKVLREGKPVEAKVTLARRP